MLKTLTALNFAKAKRYLIQQMQLECYPEELEVLRKGKCIKMGSVTCSDYIWISMRQLGVKGSLITSLLL